MDPTPERAFVIELQRPGEEGWEELFRSADEAAARQLWTNLPHTGIAARARLLEVLLVRSYEPAAARV